MLVSVIIVNYNTYQLTCNCIQSILTYTKGVEYEIVLVDNASPKDNADDFLVAFPSITLVKSKENGGFSKGNNLGIEAAKGDIILLLNSDTYLTEDSISKSAQFYNDHPQFAALTVRLTYPNGRLQHTARKFRTIKNELLDLCRPLVKLMPYRKMAALMMNQYFNGDFNTPCDWVSGAYMMFRRDLLHLMPEGKLDERFFMYGEDQLWCYLFQKAGFINYYFCETTVVHIHMGSTPTEKQKSTLNTILRLECYLYDLRNNKPVQRLVFRGLFFVKEKTIFYIKYYAYRLFKKKL